MIFKEFYFHKTLVKTILDRQVISLPFDPDNPLKPQCQTIDLKTAKPVKPDKPSGFPVRNGKKKKRESIFFKKRKEKNDSVLDVRHVSQFVSRQHFPL